MASWELRVYAGIDPVTGRRRYRTATVRGNRADAERGLANMIAEVRANRAIGATSTLSELLEACHPSGDHRRSPVYTRDWPDGLKSS